MRAQNLNLFFLLSVLCASVLLVPLLSVQKAYSACTRTDSSGTTLTDTDCDGLADKWEDAKFYDENGDGKGVNLTGTGVKKDHKDILVEIDTMVDHENLAGAISIVKNKFLAAPVSNPDLSSGINLFVILDKRNIQHASCTSIWTGFQNLKNSNFGTSAERASNPNIVSEKEDLFHYGVAIHSQCGSTGVSGNGEQPGNDFVISLGDSGWGDSDGDGHPDGNSNQQAAAFMHELGHNLNLKHGGSANTPTCKPNYFSVMNHLYEFAGIVTTPIIDYSNTFGRDNQGHLLDETGVNGLHEPEGIVKELSSTFRGAIGHLSPPAPPALFYRTFTANGEPINYDWPTDNDATEMNVISSINFFSGYNPPCGDTTRTVSAGFKDWPNIKYWDPPEEIGGLSNTLEFQTRDKIDTAKMVAIGGNNTTNTPEAMSGSPQSLSNNSESNLLNDPSIPPCDFSDPACTDSPCDPDEQGCKPGYNTNVIDPSDPKMDIGNRTAHSTPDVSINNIKNATISKIFALDALIQSELFINSTNQNSTEILNSLHNDLITDSDSVVAHIQSSNYTKAMLELLKLQSLIAQMNPEKTSILVEIEEAINLVKSLM